MARVEIPPGLAERTGDASWTAWLDALSALVRDLLAEWQLTLDEGAGSTRHGRCALVLPVRTAGGRPAALKVTWPHPEAEHEHVALKRWAGDGAVELLRADPGRFALLLERLHPEDLTPEWDVAACETVGSLYARLHVPAPPQLRTLSSYAARWAETLLALPRDAPLPHRLVQQAASLARTFAGDPATDGVLVHGDLHYANVLAADREPWLAVDPKPLSGDPHHEPAPLLWNRFDELAGDVRRGTRARFHAVVDSAGLDEERARDWVVLRTVVAAVLDDLDPTLAVAVTKAIED